MTVQTPIALCLRGQLVIALLANDPETFKQWIAGGVEGLGESAVAELLIDWFNPLLMQEEADCFVG